MLRRCFIKLAVNPSLLARPTMFRGFATEGQKPVNPKDKAEQLKQKAQDYKTQKANKDNITKNVLDKVEKEVTHAAAASEKLGADLKDGGSVNKRAEQLEKEVHEQLRDPSVVGEDKSKVKTKKGVDNRSDPYYVFKNVDEKTL